MKTVFGHFTEEQAKKVIPKGGYCYDENGKCPFWDTMPSMDKQSCGYCHWLQKGDWEEDGTFLLWDQCKECGVNDDDESLYESITHPTRGRVSESRNKIMNMNMHFNNDEEVEEFLYDPANRFIEEVVQHDNTDERLGYYVVECNGRIFKVDYGFMYDVEAYWYETSVYEVEKIHINEYRWEDVE